MKRLLFIMLAAVFVLGIAGSVQAEELSGISKGDNEPPGIGSRALEELPAKIVEAGSVDVDVIAGAAMSLNDGHGNLLAALEKALLAAPVHLL